MAREHALPQRSGFLSAFFALVPTHFLHVLFGCLWIAVMMVQVQLFGLDGRTKTRLLRLGLFWHFLDIVWVLIFTFVFLRGLL
jgi:cytochrome o ubiquinol oxidase subunit 3